MGIVFKDEMEMPVPKAIDLCEARDKFAFVDGSCVKTAFVTSDVLSTQWDRCNAVVLTWIMNSISSDVYMGLVYSVDVERYMEREFDAFTNLPTCTCDANKELDLHNKLMNLLVKTNTLGWIIASNANQYLIVSTVGMFDVIDISTLNITIGHPNGTLATISHVGNLKLTNSIVLYDVLVVPGYCVSTLSINKIIKDRRTRALEQETRDLDVEIKQIKVLKGRHNDLERSCTSWKGVASVRNRILVYPNSDEEDEEYSMSTMKCEIHVPTQGFTSQFFNQSQHTPKPPLDKEDSSLDKILDDLLIIGAENIRKMEHEVLNRCDDINDYEDNEQEDGELPDLPNFSATNEFASVCELKKTLMSTLLGN
ncbi:hypothetical protein Tco_0363519 [Tanacetum coccineum]